MTTTISRIERESEERRLRFAQRELLQRRQQLPPQEQPIGWLLSDSTITHWPSSSSSSSSSASPTTLCCRVRRRDAMTRSIYIETRWLRPSPLPVWLRPSLSPPS